MSVPIDTPVRGRREDPLSQYARIIDETIVRIREPGAFTRKGFAFNPDGGSASVWETQTAARDVLGWLVVVATAQSPPYWTETDGHTRCFRIAERIGERVLELTGRSMIDISDEDGQIAIIRALSAAAASFREELLGRRVFSA
jgi:hypothetical protein